MTATAARATCASFSHCVRAAESRKSPQNSDFYGHRTTYSEKAHCIKDSVLLDPCVGSGNFLIYCFDLLYEMYMDQIDNYGAEYSKRDVPRLIIENNLHGIDLDERAVQLTKAGLFIKAKTKRRTIHIDHYNVVSASFRLPEYSEIGNLFDVQYFSKQFSDLLKDVWKDLQQAHKFGSLLQIDEKFEATKKALKEDIGDAQLSLFTFEKAEEYDFFEKNFYEKLSAAVSKYAIDDRKKFYAENTSTALSFLKIVTSRYDVVTSNPPYTDSAAYSGTELGIFIENNYKKPYNCTTNLYACFIKRNINYAINEGFVAMIHPHTFMNIDTFKDIRKLILTQGDLHILVDFGLDRVNLFGPGILLDAVWQIIKVSSNKEKGNVFYFNITENQQEKYKKQSFEKCIEDVLDNKENYRVRIINPQDFRKIDGMPFMFNISEGLRKKFEEKSIDESGIKVAQGIATSKNERFVRLWWEVSRDYANPIAEKWYRYAKGGPYCKWYGNNWAVLNWGDNGKELRSYKKSVLRNQEYYLKEGITYTGSGSKGTTFRVHEKNSLFDVGGSCIFPEGRFNNLNYIIAFLNSRLSFYLIDCLNPTVNTQVGDLKRVPFVKPNSEEEEEVSLLSNKCIRIKKEIDAKYILNGSINSPLHITSTVKDGIKEVIVDEIGKYTSILLYEYLIDQKINSIYELDENDIKRMEEKMGSCAASIPVYQEALTEYFKVVSDDSALNKAIANLPIVNYDATTIEDIKDKICTVLYSKNNEIEDFCKNNAVSPITIWYFVKFENVLPHVKAKDLVYEWFEFAMRDILNNCQDGILGVNNTDTPIVQVLEEYADGKGINSAQLLQMEEYLGKKIRDFMEQDFFQQLMDDTNVFMYLPKTPFIWHLSSGEKRGFEVFVSIYKWNSDSLYKLKSNYISKRREKLEFRRTQLGNNNTAQTLEERELIDKQLKEIDTFVKKIDELIASGYDPKLDDGVGKNIAPLQEKMMLKVDVLNANQMKKYLKAEW